MKKVIPKDHTSVKYVNRKVAVAAIREFTYKTRRDQMKLEKELQNSRNESGVKKRLYKKIRLEGDKMQHNFSMQLCDTEKHEIIPRCQQQSETQNNASFDRNSIHKNDIKRLEFKIMELDQEIKEAEKKRGEVYNGNSTSTHETEFYEDEGKVSFDYTPIQIPERKSMPVGVKNTLGKICGLLTHMVDLVSKDPYTTPSLLSEISVEISENKLGNQMKRAQSKKDSKRLSFNPHRKRKVWKEDIEFYSNYSKNSLTSKSFSHKHQKRDDSQNYLTFSEREESPIKFKVKSKKSPKVSQFCIPTTIANLI